MLTDPQKATLKAAILADPAIAQSFIDGDLGGTAAYMNAPATPNFYVWKTSVSVGDLMQQAGFDWTRVDNLTVGKARIWDFMTKTVVLDPSRPNVRAGIESCWSVEAGDQTTRQACYDGSQRVASRFEKLFATGTGTASTHHGSGPATMAVEGPLSYTDLIGL